MIAVRDSSNIGRERGISYNILLRLMQLFALTVSLCRWLCTDKGWFQRTYTDILLNNPLTVSLCRWLCTYKRSFQQRTYIHSFEWPIESQFVHVAMYWKGWFQQRTCTYILLSNPLTVILCRWLYTYKGSFQQKTYLHSFEWPIESQFVCGYVLKRLISTENLHLHSFEQPIDSQFV